MKKKIQRMAFIIAHEGGKIAAQKFNELHPDLTHIEKMMLAIEVAANLTDYQELIFRKALWAEAAK